MDVSALIPIVLVAGAFYLLILRPAQRRQKDAQAVASALEPGKRVMTTAGLFGTVVAVEDGELDLEIAPGVVVRYVVGAVAKVIEPPAPADPRIPASEGTDGVLGSSSQDDTPLP